MRKKEKLINLAELATKLDLTERAYLSSLFKEAALCLETPFTYNQSEPRFGHAVSGTVFYNELITRCEYVEKYLNHYLVEFTAAAKERK